MILAPGEPPTAVRWYFAPPGAQWLGIPNAFTSSTWDYAPSLGPYPLGEPSSASTWDKGENHGWFPGKCRVGTAEEYLHGAHPATIPPSPLPDCCRATAGQVWHLRSDLSPSDVPDPSTFLLPWDNTGVPSTGVALSPFQGTGSQETHVHIHISTGPFAFTDAFFQYSSGPIGQGTLTARAWKLALGFQVQLMPSSASLRFVFSLALLDGELGTVKQLLADHHAIGPLISSFTGRRSDLATFNVPAVPVSPGDFLLLEIGVQFGYPLVLPGFLDFSIFDCGTGPINGPNASVNNPDALLDYSSGPPIPGDDVIPAGTIFAFAGPALPTGYLLCDGGAYPLAAFPALFAAIGTSWGTPGAGLFNVPDLRGRSPVGSSPGALGPDRPSARAVAGNGGEEAHTLLLAELAAHGHPVVDPGHAHSPSDMSHFWTDGVVLGGGVQNLGAGTSALPGFTSNDTTGLTVANAGADGPHNTMHPFAVVNWIIKT